MRRVLFAALFAVFAAVAPAKVQSDIIVDVNPDDTTNGAWLGFMNVFNLPSDGGAFQFGSGWGPNDLNSVRNVGAGTISMSPNTIGDPNPYWYIGGGAPGSPGNKIMDANLYKEVTGPFAGQTITFNGKLDAYTYTSAHKGFVFLRDFAPDFSSVVETKLDLSTVTPGSTFSISLATINDPARHVQYGFQSIGVNVWVTDTAPFGGFTVSAVPEPATLMTAGMAALVLVARRRRRSN